MEKYANNLEQLVDERTDQLVEEKKKTGEFVCFHSAPSFYMLNCKMIPPGVQYSAAHSRWQSAGLFQ